MIRHILVPLDGSALAEAVLPHARELAAGLGARVTLLGVVDPLAPPDAGAAPGSDGARREPGQAAAPLRAYLDAVAQALLRAGVAAQARVATGGVAEQIVEAGRAAGLIAMTTHGRGGLDRLVHGSVADQVVRQATTPVLLVRPLALAPAPAAARRPVASGATV